MKPPAPHVEISAFGQTSARAAREGRAGSRGGAAIWMLHHEGFNLMPKRYVTTRSNRLCTCLNGDRDPQCPRHSRYVTDGPSPDGTAIFGRYPKGFLGEIVRQRLLGDVHRDEILHVCSGTLGPDEHWTVDIRPEAKPLVIASGTALPFRDSSFKAIMLDPPYSDEYAKNLYGTENPRPSWLLREAARVVQPCGRIGILHVAIPFAPPGCWLLKVYPVSTGVGFRIRAFTIYERSQARLL